MLADHQYQYNDGGQITQLTDLGGAHAYLHDAVNRLTSATYPNTPAENYTYDAVGNRTSSHQSTSNGHQGFNKLVSTATATYSYDANGNLKQKTDSAGTWVYNWNAENRLTKVTRPDGVSVSYKYDALGRRVQRVPSNGATTNYIYDGQDVVKDLLMRKQPPNIQYYCAKH